MCIRDRKGKLQRHDLVLTTRGTVGNVGYYGENVAFDHIRINSGMVIFRTEISELDPLYFYQFVRSSNFQNQVEALRTGSAQPQLPIRDINRIKLPLPPLSTQKAIAHILGTLDDKIELNRQTNKTLEAIAKAIFKSWFVDFDPVHYKQGSTQKNRKSLNAAADEKGASTPNGDPTDAARYSLSPEILDLFPDSFQDSELGEIPARWIVSTFDEHIDILSGGTPKTSVSEYWDGGIPWYTVKDLSLIHISEPTRPY